MHARRPLTPGQRRDAWSRLHTLTSGVALAGIAATAAIGAVAAADNPGKASGVATVNQGDDSGVDDGPLAPDPRASSDPSTNGLAPLPTPRNRVQVPRQQATQPPTRGSGRGHASSGGS